MPIAHWTLIGACPFNACEIPINKSLGLAPLVAMCLELPRHLAAWRFGRNEEALCRGSALHEILCGMGWMDLDLQIYAVRIPGVAGVDVEELKGPLATEDGLCYRTHGFCCIRASSFH